MNIPDDCGYETKFEHSLCLNDHGVPFGFINWCLDNCYGRWGWFFERDLARFYIEPDKHSIAYMSFEIEEDLILFSLTHDLTNKHTK